MRVRRVQSLRAKTFLGGLVKQLPANEYAAKLLVRIRREGTAQKDGR